MSITTLEQFVSDWQYAPLVCGDDVATASDELASSFENVWGKRSDEYQDDFRSSALGRNVAMVAYERFYPTVPSAINEPSFITRFKFTTGYLLEAHVAMLLKSLDINFEFNPHFTVQLPDGPTVGGTPDFVLDDCIIETKCVNPKVFYSWKKKGYVDSFQYQMQLAMYCSKAKKPGAFLVCDVSTGELALYHFDYTRYAARLLIALQTITRVYRCSEFWQCLEFCAPPTPMRRKDGTFYFPPTAYQSKGVLHSIVSLYDYEVVDGKYVVNGYNYPESAKQWEPVLV